MAPRNSVAQGQTQDPASGDNFVNVTRPTKVEAPGNPDLVLSFLTIREDERKPAGYLGFNNSSDLRQVVFAWPFVKAYIEFAPIAKGVRKGAVLRLISSSETTLFNYDPTPFWARYKNLPDTDYNGLATDKEIIKHIAWVLLHMENDFNLYALDSEANNKALSEQYRPFMAEKTGKSVPDSVARCPVPVLGPFNGEGRLESLNRCWNLLRWVGTLLRRNTWTRLATQAAIDKGKKVEVVDLPTWMQPVVTQED